MPRYKISLGAAGHSVYLLVNSWITDNPQAGLLT